jgi:hypothetical protein
MIRPIVIPFKVLLLYAPETGVVVLFNSVRKQKGSFAML